MELLHPPKEVVPFGLRAMAMIAKAGEKGISDVHRALLYAAQKVILKTEINIDQLSSIEPSELAKHFTNHALAEQLTLAYPVKGGGDFILDTDASNYAIGAALHQLQNGEEKLLRFASRCMNTAEKNYCTTRKELLAVVNFLDYFKHYLIGDGVKVVVRTDHGSLRWLKNLKNPSGQVARWMEKLSWFNWNIQHRAGRNHGNADALSRGIGEGHACTSCVHRHHHESVGQCCFAIAILATFLRNVVPRPGRGPRSRSRPR